MLLYISFDYIHICNNDSQIHDPHPPMGLDPGRREKNLYGPALELLVLNPHALIIKLLQLPS